MAWQLYAALGGLHVANWILGKLEGGSNDRQEKFGDASLPLAQEGHPIPICYGRNRIKGPTLAWSGDYEAVEEREEIDGESIVIAHRIKLGMHFILSVSVPIGVGNHKAELRGMYFGDRLVRTWDTSGDEDLTGGTQADGPNAPELFGGRGNGGGIVGGNVNFYRGIAVEEQIADTYLETHLGVGSVPGYRHFVHMVMTQHTIGESARIPPMSIDFEQYPSIISTGQHLIGLPAEEDANPAYILYDILTNPWARVGIPTAQVDSASFIAAATTLLNEDHGMSFILGQPNDASQIVTEILRQIDGLIYEEPSDRKIYLKLIREDYDPDDLVLYDEANIIDGSIEWDITTWNEVFNEARVVYLNRTENYAQRTAFTQSMVNKIHANERSRITESNYLGVSNKALAQKLAERELQALAQPLKRITFQCNRDGFDLRPGDVLKFSNTEMAISELVVRVQSVNLGTLEDAAITVTGLADRFGSQDAVFGIPDFTAGVTLPDADMADGIRGIEVPRQIGTGFEEHTGGVRSVSRVMYLVRSAASSAETGYYGQASTDAGANYNSDAGYRPSPFTPYAEVETAYGQLLEPYDTATGLRIDSLTDITVLDTATATEIREERKNLILVGDEFMAYESFTDLTGGVYRLNNVWRGLLDTVPAAQAVNNGVWFTTAPAWIDNIGRQPFAGTETVRTRPLTTTGASRQGPGTAGTFPTHDVVLSSRALKPLPVASLRVSGSNDPGVDISGTTKVVENEVEVTWLRRLRDTDTIKRGDEADETPEAGTVYDIDWNVDNGGWVQLAGDVDDTSSFVEMGQEIEGSVEMRVVTDGTGAVEGFQDPQVDFELAQFRQFLANPHFDDATDGRAWTVESGTPAWTGGSGGYGRSGTYLDNAGGASTTLVVSQVVEMEDFNPNTKDAVLFWKESLDSGSLGTIAVELEELDGNDGTLAKVVKAASTPTSTGYWDRQELISTNLHAFTAKLNVTITIVNGAGNERPRIDDMDLRVHDSIEGQSLSNPHVNVDLTGWTTSTGTWARDTSNNEEGAACLAPTGASATPAEIYSEVTFPGSIAENDVALLRCHLRQPNNGVSSTVKIEVRSAADAILASATTGALTGLSTSAWVRKDLYVAIPASGSPTKVRVTLTGVDGGGDGNDNCLFDDMWLYFFEESL